MSNEKDVVDSYAKGFFLGALVGGAVGAVTALLFAPKSGRELRRDIADKSGEFYEKAGDYFDDVQDETREMVNQGRAKAQNIVTAAKRQAESILASAENTMREARYRAAQTKDALQDGAERTREAARAGVEAFRKEMSGDNAEGQETELL